MPTLVLTHADVLRLLDALPLLELLRKGFIHHSAHKGPDSQRAHSVLGGEGAAMVIFPGTLPDVPAYSVKVHAQFPGSDRPIQGVVNLFDSKTGALLAIIDSTHLTTLRTGVSAALSADVLARPDAARVALIGATKQASVALRSIRLVRSLREVWIYDRDVSAAHDLAQRSYNALALPCHEADNIESAVAEADIVIVSVASREPLLFPGMLPNGTHVIALGADEPGLAELSANLLRQSRLFTDDRALSAGVGALAAVGVQADLATELGEVLADPKKGRANPQEITLYVPVGLPFQDLAASWLAYEGALHDPDVVKVELGP